VQVLHRERVTEGTGQEEAAARDRQDQIGLEAVSGDRLREFPGRLPESLPAKSFPLVVHVLPHRQKCP
jgi:hypothetical protein